ncbi:protein peste-like [Anopheles marshallii]|uniref:protein peste-like n=1 Tax=Anopheles marshallii TaxID=1521116 RepID=UPI00237C0E1B|nr:protein peste-like [Anopheles marshallii]
MGCCRWYLVVGLGLGTAATGLIFMLAWPDIFDILVSEEKSLLPGSALYKEWRRPTMHPSWQFYLYNWSNAQAFLSLPQAAPTASFQELGPYTYDEYTEVVDVKFHQGNGTLSYRKRTVFRRNAFGAQPEMITSVNFVALLTSHLARNVDYSLQREMSFLLHNHHQPVTVTRPIGQLLFTGQREPMLEQMRRLLCTGKHHGVPCQDERLAYLRTFNVSRRPSEIYSMDVGMSDRSTYGVVRSGGSTARRAAGSAFQPCDGFEALTGELFPSRVERDKPITIVLPELCRRLTLEFDQELLLGGIMGYRYTARLVRPFSTQMMEANGMASCPDVSIRLGRYGMLNSNECNGLPLYESEPTPYSNQSDGDRRQLYYVLEPTTGTVLESYIGLAYHTVLRPNEHIALFQNVPELRVPLFRFDRYYRLGEPKAAKLRQLLHLLEVGHQAALAGCTVGISIVLLTAIYACWKSRTPSKNRNDEYSIMGLQLRNGGRNDQLMK